MFFGKFLNKLKAALHCPGAEISSFAPSITNVGILLIFPKSTFFPSKVNSFFAISRFLKILSTVER